MKALNLYAGLGGNRKLWGDEHEITAIENNPEVAALYKKHFPNDEVIITDAHQYLLENHKRFDFIWSSFPCTTHTRMNVNFGIERYPDLGLYEEIIFLNHFCKDKKWVVENVIPYYDLILPEVPVQQFNRHLFWANFKIRQTDKRNPPKTQTIISQKTKRKRKNYDGDIVNIKSTVPHYGFDLSDISMSTRKDAILRNCVDPEIGLMIFNCALVIFEKQTQQLSLI